MREGCPPCPDSVGERILRRAPDKLTTLHASLSYLSSQAKRAFCAPRRPAERRTCFSALPPEPANLPTPLPGPRSPAQEICCLQQLSSSLGRTAALSVGSTAVGDAAITDRRVTINRQINALIPSKQVESIFLWHLVRALSKVIQNRATGVMTRIINKSALENIAAIRPPSILQNEFAACVAKIRELDARQASSRERLDALFQSMLHRAFRGEL